MIVSSLVSFLLVAIVLSFFGVARSYHADRGQRTAARLDALAIVAVIAAVSYCVAVQLHPLFMWLVS